MNKQALSFVICSLLLTSVQSALASDSALDSYVDEHRQTLELFEEGLEEVEEATLNESVQRTAEDTTATPAGYSGELPFSNESYLKRLELLNAYKTIKLIFRDFDKIERAHIPDQRGDGYASREDFKAHRERLLALSKEVLALATEMKATRLKRVEEGGLSKEELIRLEYKEERLVGLSSTLSVEAASLDFWLEEANWTLLSHAHLDHQTDTERFANAEQETVFVSKKDVEILSDAIMLLFFEGFLSKE